MTESNPASKAFRLFSAANLSLNCKFRLCHWASDSDTVDKSWGLTGETGGSLAGDTMDPRFGGMGIPLVGSVGSGAGREIEDMAPTEPKWMADVVRSWLGCGTTTTLPPPKNKISWLESAFFQPPRFFLDWAKMFHLRPDSSPRPLDPRIFVKKPIFVNSKIF